MRLVELVMQVCASQSSWLERVDDMKDKNKHCEPHKVLGSLFLIFIFIFLALCVRKKDTFSLPEFWKVS